MFITPSASPKALSLCERAAQELILRFAFAGLVLCGEHIIIRVEEGVCGTLCTDGRTIWVDPAYITRVYSTEGLRGVVFRLLHEYFHCFFNHPERGRHRDKRAWNWAIDVMTNRLCCESLTTPNDLWKTPEDGVQPDGWEQYTTAEAIYDALMAMSGEKRNQIIGEDTPGSGEFNGGDLLLPPFQTEAERDEFQALLSEEILQAQAIMDMNPSSAPLPDAVRRRLSKIKEGKVPWGKLLSGQLLTDIGDKVATFAPPRRRTYPWLIQPSLKGLKEKKLFLLIDNSTSVGEHLHKEFRSATKPAARRADEIHIIGFDSRVREHIIIKRVQEIDRKLKYVVGSHSHTSVVDAFALVDKHRPSGIACLTDGHIELPTYRPQYKKTIWCTPVNGKRQPWGVNFIMDVAW